MTSSKNNSRLETRNELNSHFEEKPLYREGSNTSRSESRNKLTFLQEGHGRSSSRDPKKESGVRQKIEQMKYYAVSNKMYRCQFGMTTEGSSAISAFAKGSIYSKTATHTPVNEPSNIKAMYLLVINRTLGLKTTKLKKRRK